ncbi:hypothetical protein GCM10017608_04800 [Agromyces luteolus]|nr:hypothetical protein GCM10017608_04800 [Agromyces luteolus]
MAAAAAKAYIAQRHAPDHHSTVRRCRITRRSLVELMAPVLREIRFSIAGDAATAGRQRSLAR